jgi:hypothetical protein
MIDNKNKEVNLIVRKQYSLIETFYPNNFYATS